jgi:hypothetical protein
MAISLRSEYGLKDSLLPKVIERKIKPAVDKIQPDNKRRDAQKSLEKLRDAIEALPVGLDKEPWPDLKPGVKLDSAAQAKQLLAKINSAELKDIGKELLGRFGDVKEHAEDLREALGKDKSVAEAIKALGDIVVDGQRWALDSGRFGSRCTEWVTKEQKRLEELEAGSSGASSETTRMISKTRTALKMIRSGAGDVTYPFIAADSGKDLFIYVAADAQGGGAEERVKIALGDEGKGAKVIKGECGFLNRKYYFASAKLSGGTYAVRFQKRFQADLGQRLPIGVGTDKSKLEVLDADDFDDPLDFLIAERGPLASGAKRCKALREAVIKELKKAEILKAGGVLARQAENLLERAETAAANSDLADFERAMDAIRKDVLGKLEGMKKRQQEEKGKFQKAFDEIKPGLEALRKDVMQRILEVEAAVREGVLEETANTAAQARRRELREATKEYDDIAPRILKGDPDVEAEDLFSEGLAVILTLKKAVTDMTSALVKDRAAEAQARKDKAKEEKKKGEAEKAKSASK